MSRAFLRVLRDECEIFRLVEKNVPGNPPKLSHEKIEGTFKCRYSKISASFAKTIIGDVPTSKHILFLLPDTEIKENYRVHVNGKEYTVEEVLPMKRFSTIHHLEAELKARS